jgi:pimeloyl-ACP methyl ester carboxylesterase
MTLDKLVPNDGQARPCAMAPADGPWPRETVGLACGTQVSVVSAPGPAGGEPVLCVHGMAGAATNWTDFQAEIGGEFACDAIDLPGSGWSPPPASTTDYSATALAGAVTAFIERRARGPVHLVGNSMGGLISVKVAATRPDLVRTLTLVSPALPDRKVRPLHLEFPLLGLPRVGGWLLARADAHPAEARVRGVLNTIFYYPASVSRGRFAEAVAEMERRDTLDYADDALIGAARTITAEYLRPGWSADNAWRQARAVRCPVLAVYGSHDPLVSARMAGRAAREFGDCRVIVLPYTRHVAQMEHPARVAAEFRELVAAARARRAGDPPAVAR